MNIDYSDIIMESFASPQHVYNGDKNYNLIGYAGDTRIGEYVHLYFNINRESQYADSKIIEANFSAIGSVMLIAAAEKFCELVKNLTFQEAILYTEKLSSILAAPEEKIYSVMFVTQAFYKALETLATS